MPVSSPVARDGGGQSCWSRIKLGFFFGMSIGLASGGLFGGFAALRAGLRGAEMIGATSKAMMQGAGTFGTFMAIGSGIRC